MRLPLPVARALVFAGSRPMGRPVPVRAQRALFEASSRLGRLPPGTRVETLSLGGRSAERVAVGEARGRPVLLLHGGAFVTGSPRTHRVFAAHLALAAAAPVHVLDYRRAPEHPYPAAVDDADAALEELAAGGPVAVVGDSAGGAVALLLALRRQREGRPLPAALALVSPLVDLTLASSDGYRGRDPLLRRSWVADGGAAFAGNDPVAASPLFSDLAGLPPTLVHVSEHERLRPEGEALAARLRKAGVDVEHELLPRLWHDAHVHADLVPEAADAVARMGRWLAARTS
jgi:epsilon-lactone hydrolase